MKWNSSLYDQKHSFVFKYGEEVLALLNPKRGERILDVGCGTGHLTKLIAEMGAEVVGIDSSPEMIEAARTAWPDINFVLADAADFSFTEPFDAVFSNAALHWVTEAERAVVCMARSLKQGGRVVVELGGKGNIAAIKGLRNWIAMFDQGLMSHVPDHKKEQVLRKVEDKTRCILFADGHWFADYIRLRIVAHKE